MLFGAVGEMGSKVFLVIMIPSSSKNSETLDCEFT